MDVYPYFLVKNIPCLRESNSPLPLGEGLGVRATPLARWERGWDKGHLPSPADAPKCLQCYPSSLTLLP